MVTVQFRLPIGAKRQVTIPRQCMDMLALEEGGQLLLEIVGDHAILLPVVSVPRRDLPEALRKKFESRRGQKSSDIPLREFLGEMGYEGQGRSVAGRSASTGGKKVAARKTTPVRRSLVKAH